MENIKIDYNTANIVFPINTSDGAIQVYLPPVSKEEIKSNALVLGGFAGIIDNIGIGILITDYDIYIKEIIEKQAEDKYRIDDMRCQKYIDESTIKINAMLERSIAAGYYFHDNDIKPVSNLEEEAKDIIKGSLLFFIVVLRYIRPRMTAEEWEESIKQFKISFTSLSVTEWKNTFMIQSQK